MEILLGRYGAQLIRITHYWLVYNSQSSKILPLPGHDIEKLYF